MDLVIKGRKYQCGSFFIWDFSFPQKLIDESGLFCLEASEGGYSVADPGGQGPDPPPPPLSGKYYVLVNK